MTTLQIPPHRETLSQLSAEIAGAFSVAFAEIGTIRGAAADLEGDVVRLLSAADNEGASADGIASIEAYLSNATCAAKAAEDAAKALTERSFQDALVSVASTLNEIRKYVLELGSISSLTKVTQPTEAEIADRLVVFTQTLDSRCSDLRASASKSSDLVVSIQNQSGLARNQLTAISLEFQGISDRSGSQIQYLRELEEAHRTHIGLVREHAGVVGAGVAKAVAELIGCLQFPDAFSQRAEHVRAALDAIETAPLAQRDAIAAVASAQLQSMADALTTVTSGAERTLGTIVETLSQRSTIGSKPETVDPSGAWMDASARTNDAMLKSVDRARKQLGLALSLLTGLASQIDTARENLEASVQLNLDLETSVHNASIVASRSSSSNSLLRFLAGAVKDAVSQSSGLIHRISNALMTIRKTSGVLGSTTLERDLQNLSEIQEAAMATAATQKRMIDIMHSARHDLLGRAGSLTGAAAAATHAFRAAGEHAEALGALAKELGRISSGGEITGSDLGWLYASYTMEEERIVHRETLCLPEIQDEEEGESEELDDFVL